MFRIEELENEIRVYNDGILILESKDIGELRELILALIDGSEDTWEVEILGNILYYINNNLSTTEVA
ncbi:hypothetical protein PMY38_04490 [Clostridium tertium]|uniref:hypothetical protein n=1 Tax=Clostridium tertium TaxID=1559 RepID=UPI00232F5FDA|nr:hypothetical protein [Clostridium tertium]MDB1954212.1 hypothetical protein [Clostridium tertium]MDB1957849.1 hypothetical protein [Clostridium tertium]MDB1961699.1 hypothetical protein [Clostridium tertium]MDB1965042.1 hypothetical protein [Clostridium tertium]